MREKIWNAFHPVFEMFYSNLHVQPCIDSVDNPDSGSERKYGRFFIWYSVFEMLYSNLHVQPCIDSVYNLDACIDCVNISPICAPLYAEFSHLILLCIRCCVRATNTSVNSVDKHSIKCIACFDLRIDSVDKQDTLHNTK